MYLQGASFKKCYFFPNNFKFCAAKKNYMAVSFMKETIYVYCPKLTQIMNDCLKNFFFLIYILKKADIYVYFKKRK